MPEDALRVSNADCEVGVDAITLEEAWAKIDSMFSCVTSIREASLLESLGSILAQSLVSPIDLPPFNNSAMDGYAFSHTSLNENAEGWLRLSQTRLTAGTEHTAPLSKGEAVRIFTGAPLPHGADTVAMQEHCIVGDGIVNIPRNVSCGQNCRPAGGDVHQGQVLLEKGIRLRPQDLALAAATGHERLSIYRPLRVAVLSTGDELHEPGQPLPQGGIFDSNRYGVMALLKWMGCDVLDMGIIPDDFASIVSTLKDASNESDVIISSGGMSVGEEDHVKAAISTLGEMAFWRVNIKPGKPVGIASILGRPLIALPGNPVSAIVTFMLIARSVLLRLSGCRHAAPRSFHVESMFDHECKGRRREFLRGRLISSLDGRVRVEKFRTESSGVISSLVETDGLIDLAGMENVRVGQLVPFLPFDMLR